MTDRKSLRADITGTPEYIKGTLREFAEHYDRRSPLNTYIDCLGGGGFGKLVVEDVHPGDVGKVFPPLPGLKGRTYFCQDSDGAWHYLNHLNDWVACPAPFGAFSASQK